VSRQGRGFRPHKVTGAGPGYFPAEKDSEEPIAEIKKKSSQKDRSKNSVKLRKGRNFQKLKYQNRIIKSEIEFSKVDGNQERDIALRLVLVALRRLSAKILFIGHVLPSISGIDREDPLLQRSFPFTFSQEIDVEEILLELASKPKSVGNIQRKNVNYRRIRIKAELPKGWDIKSFVTELALPNGKLR
jgi:hypothetical protein